MEFRPCIDIHNGKIKQIVGASLIDKGNNAEENFVSSKDGAFFARKYQEYGLKGGHIILLNPAGSEFYEATKAQAFLALQTYRNGLQIGGGITDLNAMEFLNAGASHVIVTSYVFSDGRIHFDHLEKLVNAVGSEHIVLDLSCKKQGEQYVIMTDRWQKYTTEILNVALLDRLSVYCDEFLIHAVDVEGKSAGIELPLVKMLGSWGKKPITYAGGVHNMADLQQLEKEGQNRVHVTIGSALDLFGGPMQIEKVVAFCENTAKK